MHFAKKTLTIGIAILLILSIAASTILSGTFGQVPKSPGDTQTVYPYIAAGPNPIGVGQTLTLNFFMAAPMLTSESVTTWTVEETFPDGHKTTLGPFNSDATGGSYTTVVPTETGVYDFQAFFGEMVEQNGVIALAAESNIVHVTVQDEPVTATHYPITPLPTQWWQTPVTAENVQEWYKINGPWLGYGSVTFAQTGGYNYTGNFNPQTESVLSGHVLWTKIWAEGGLTGLTGNEESGHYWSTSQYWPKYAPVIINGVMYSDWKSETNSYSNGVMATDIYTGETLWVINTTSQLRCGMVTQWHTINAYGAIGPYIWTTGGLTAAETGGRLIGTPGSFGFGGGTPAQYSSFMNTTGTQWNMYSALTGKYVLSVVNGTNPTITTDENGNMIGYYINSTVGTMTTYGNAPTFSNPPKTGIVNIEPGRPVLVKWNMSQALGNTWGWGPSVNTIIPFDYGVMWAEPLAAETDTGAPINNGAYGNPTLAINGITDNAIVMTAGFTGGQGFGGQQNGWLLAGAMDANTGAQLWAHNFTALDTPTLSPDSRTNIQIQDGKLMFVNMVASEVFAINARTGTKAWNTELRNKDGSLPVGYTIFGLRPYNGPDATMVILGFGGDIWTLNVTTGDMLWQTTTNELLGNPGLETPYGTWPLWVFSSSCTDNNVAYLTIGHEYNPPLFHGAQLLALNITDGSLIWKTLDTSVESTSIAYGIVLSRNAYDNQIYAFGKGPSATTVTAPDPVTSVGSPMIIRGTVMDVSPGTRAIVQPDVTKTKQNEIALRFPNGLPCVSDESQSAWMEYVYQQQLAPSNATGVEVLIDVIDANGNYRNIGTATSDTSGMFTYTWTPDISGDYTVIATFAGSNSYYGSTAETSFHATEAPQATPEPTPMPQSLSDMYILPGIIGIIIAIVIVGAVLFLLLRRR